MAKPYSWLPRLADIRRSVAGSMREQYDRKAIETLFELMPKSAGNLMRLMVRVRAPGGARLVDREVLASFLDSVHGADDASAALGKIKANPPKVRRSIRVKVKPNGGLVVGPLPEYVKLERGNLGMSFETVEEFCLGLLPLLAMLDADLDGFERNYCVAPAELVEAQTREGRDLEELRAEIRRTEEEFNTWIAKKKAEREAVLFGRTEASPAMAV